MAKYQPKLDLTDWKRTSTQEVDKIMAIVAPELHSFIEEHAALSQLMDRVREGYDTEIYREALNQIGHELEHHFLFEEKYILSRLENHIPETEVGPIAKLKSEHDVIRKHHREALAMFEGHDPENPSQELIQKMGLLAYLLKKHIEKEDHYLFPLFSVILTEDEKAAIARDVNRPV
jgi:hemerythrin-like domain-containing protein